MRFRADSKLFLAALGHVASLDASGDPAGAVVTATAAGQVTVCGHGDYVTLRLAVPATVEVPGEFVTAALTAAAYSRAVGGELLADVQGEVLGLSGTRWGVSLPRSLDFPRFPQITGQPSFVLEVEKFLAGVSWAHLTVGKEDEGQYIFQAVEVGVSGETLEVAATDGRSLFYSRVPAAVAAPAVSVIPRQAVATLLKVLGSEGRVWGWLTPTGATFATESVVCACAVAPAAKFPPWRRVRDRLAVPVGSATFSAPREEVQSAAKLCGSVPKKEIPGAAFRFSDGTLRVEARGGSSSSAWAEMPASEGTFATVLDLRSVSAFCKGTKAEHLQFTTVGGVSQVALSDGLGLHAVLSPVVPDRAMG